MSKLSWNFISPVGRKKTLANNNSHILSNRHTNENDRQSYLNVLIKLFKVTKRFSAKRHARQHHGLDYPPKQKQNTVKDKTEYFENPI